ncbi:CPBP family intramembrane glutamic endopeptidase [Clostridium taeniosporum]|nr:type II CAAX endopeptidase family protein [Clostridium taeniosporum]
MFGFGFIGELFKLNDLVFLCFYIGEIITVFFTIIYLYKKFNLNLKSLLIPKKINPKELILMLLMLFCSYIVINLLTHTITSIAHIAKTLPDNNDEIGEVSDIAGMCFLICLTIIGPTIEEFFFRGIFLLKLKDNSNTIVALILSAFLFGILHPYGYAQQIRAFITGLFFGIIALKTNNIFYTIIGHIIFNSLTMIFGIIRRYSNFVQLGNGCFHFNAIINITSIVIFSVTLFILYKVPLSEVKI